MSNAPTRPSGISDDMLVYLDDLRESGETNMFGAASYVDDAFEVGMSTAKEVVKYWMETFGNDTR